MKRQIHNINTTSADKVPVESTSPAAMKQQVPFWRDTTFSEISNRFAFDETYLFLLERATIIGANRINRCEFV